MSKIRKKLWEQTTTGGAVVNAGAHVDLAQGMFDRPGPNPNKQSNFTFDPRLKPVVPTEMVATQLAVGRPPIEDDSYVPTSSQELAYAVSEISKSVPADQIKNFYDKVKEYSQESEDNENTEELDARGENEMMENAKRAAVKKYINEVLNGMLREAAEDNAVKALRKRPGALKTIQFVEPSSFEDIRPVFGTKYGGKGVSGVRQAVFPIEKKWTNLVRYFHDETIEKLSEMQGEVPAIKDALIQKYSVSKNKVIMSLLNYLVQMTENPDGSPNQAGMQNLARTFISERIIDPEQDMLVEEMNSAAIKWIMAKLPYLAPTYSEDAAGAGLFDTLRRLLNGDTAFDARTAPSRVFDQLVAEGLPDDQHKDAVKKLFGGSTLGLSPQMMRDKEAVLSRVKSLLRTPLEMEMRRIQELREEINENVLDRIEYFQSENMDSKIEDLRKTVDGMQRFNTKYGA